MSAIVFIIGAGASQECGAPLMKDFLDVANHFLHRDSAGDKKEHFEKVFKAIGALQSVHSKAQLDLTNIESIFTAFEIANVLCKLPGHPAEDIPGVIASLKEVIVKTLEETIVFPTSDRDIQTPKPYDKFAQLIEYLRKEAHPQHSVSIITFNYDIAMDIGLYQQELGPDYGIPPASKFINPIPLYKLHGSLNWARRKDTNSVLPLHLADYFRKYQIPVWNRNGTCKIPIGSQLQEYFKRHKETEVEPEPFIVPPTWNKSDYHQSLSMVWSKAAEDLSSAQTIFICGYSLPETDAFFRLLYALGAVGSAPLEKLIVYNPDNSGDTDQRFQKLLGPGARARYQYKTMIFNEAIDHIKSLFPPKKR